MLHSTTSRFDSLFWRALILAATLSIVSRPALPDSLYNEERSVTRLAEGVYAIRHQDPYPGWVNGNTTVVIGDREVLVVDSCQFSFFAQEDIAQIREWTSTPVRYLVNTHWHADHNGGNAEYAKAFPGLAIVAHEATKDRLADAAPNYSRDISRDALPLRDKLSRALEVGKLEDGTPLTDATRADTASKLARIERVLEALPRFTPSLPTLTFHDGLRLDLGNREVEVLHPGRGNTAGDVVVYLPKEKILATGDLLVSPVPYAFDGYPVEWTKTLEWIDGLDASILVPGHGGVQRDEHFLRLVLETMRTIVDQVHEGLRKEWDASLEDVRKSVDVSPFRARFAEGDQATEKFFSYSVGVKFVELAYYEAKQR